MKGFTFGFMVLVGTIVLITTIILLSGRGEGATITVDDDGGADHTRIQDAIDNATAGDTVRVIHTITHVVRDNLGDWSDPVTMDIEVIPTPENMRPTVEITSHTNGSKISGTIVISGTASVADGTIDRVEISIDNGTWTTVTRFITWSHMIDTSTLTEGEHMIRVRSYDSIEYSEIETIILIVEHDDSREGGDEGLIPGFGLATSVGAIALALITKRR